MLGLGEQQGRKVSMGDGTRKGTELSAGLCVFLRRLGWAHQEETP